MTTPQQPKTLNDVVAGDLVAITVMLSGLRRGMDTLRRRVVAVNKATPKLLYVAGDAFRRADGIAVDRYTSGVMSVATQADIREHAEKERIRKDQEEKRKAYNARPDVQIAEQLACLDTDAWLRLSLASLQAIQAEIAATRGTEGEGDKK